VSAHDTTIHVVDDDASLRDALARLLGLLGYTVRTWESAADFLDARPKGPGCVLLDVKMPGMDGLELQRRLNALGEVPPIVFLSAHGDIPMSVQAMRMGAEDFLTKPVRRDALVAALERALARDAAAREAAAATRARKARLDALTPREREVLSHVVRGRLNKQIASDLGTTERTIKAHRAAITEKLGMRTVAELVNLCAGLDLGKPAPGR